MKIFQKTTPTPDRVRETWFGRLRRKSTTELLVFIEGQLGASWQAFDAFQSDQTKSTLREYTMSLSMLLAAADALDEKLDLK